MIVVPSITDVNGTTHENCPRCGGAWVNSNNLMEPDFQCESNKPFSIDKCIRGYNTIWMGRYKYQLACYKLACYIFDTSNVYNINWDIGFCEVSRQFQGDTTSTKLPLLPYDITLDKLKTYLLFS